MSYQPPTDDRDDAAARQPPGWYLDPIEQQALRWWNGAQWGLQTQPLPGIAREPQHPYPDATTPASGRYDAHHQQSAGWHQRQSGPEDGTTYATGLALGTSPASFPPAPPQRQPDPYKARSADVATAAALLAGTATWSAPRTTATEEPQEPTRARRTWRAHHRARCGRSHRQGDLRTWNDHCPWHAGSSCQHA